MNRYRIAVSVTLLVLLVVGCERRLCGCDPVVESPLKGDWTLTKIAYPLIQKTVTAAEAGYTETLSFTNVGSYRRVRNGIPTETTDYGFSYSSGNTTSGIIYFPKDTTQQSFRLNNNTLYLSERIPRGATIADGSTYEYQR